MTKKRTFTKHLVTNAIKKKLYTLLAINIDGFTPEGWFAHVYLTAEHLANSKAEL